MKVVEEYIEGLKEAYYDNEGAESWNYFESIKHGVSKEDIDKLKEIYPDIPDALVKLLEFVDGTYCREYKGEKIAFYFLGSDIEEYPYYLLSAKQIYENRDKAFECYEDYVNREYEEEVEVDEKIIDNANEMKWLHFSNCMNSGGTSKLFIDFSPSEKGTKGQIVRFIHDLDEILVIANSFEEYLQMLIDNDYNFIHEDVME